MYGNLLIFFIHHFPYLCKMKKLIINLTAIGMTIIFLSLVTGIRVSEHTCLECGTRQVKIENPFSALNLIFSLNQDHSQCCNAFHQQHQDHSNTCSHSFLSYTVPFKVMKESGQNLRNPLTFLIREMNLFQVSSEKPGFLNISTTKNPVSGNILLKTCQSLT